MTVIRLNGDIIHFIAVLIVLFKLFKSKSAEGFSGKTQLLYSIIFTSRYLDLLNGVNSPFFMFGKVFLLLTSYTIVFLLFYKYKKTYEKNFDGFWVEILILPCFLFAVFLNYSQSPEEIFWLFSEFLEVFAILPQFYFIYKKGQDDHIVPFYIYCLICYRGLYILHWVYKIRYLNEDVEALHLGTGIAQFILYFFFFCIPRVPREDQVLPAGTPQLPIYIRQESLLATPLLMRKVPSLAVFTVGMPSPAPPCTPPDIAQDSSVNPTSHEPPPPSVEVVKESNVASSQPAAATQQEGKY
jgi:ER lumen protein retaining receptor